jgi:hypothetical protein
MLVHRNQLTLFQNFDGFLKRRLFDSGIPHDGFHVGPAVSLAAGAADEIGVQFELRGIQRDLEDIVGQAEELLRGRTILSQSLTSVCSSIQARNLSLGTRIRVPIRMRGNPLLRTNSYAAALEIPSTSPTSGAVKVKGRSS